MTVGLVLADYTWAVLLGTAAVLGVTYLWTEKKKRKGMPPFPSTPLPLVGNLLVMEKNPRQQILRWREKYGDIFTVDMAGNLVVFVNGYKNIKEIYVKNGHRCSDRPVLFHDTATDTVNLGIGTSSGPQWKEERATAYTILRSFGMGNGKRAENVEVEMEHFLAELDNLEGRATDIHYIIMKAVCNTVISLLFGQRFNYEDDEFKSIVETITRIIQMAGSTQILQFYPALANLPGDFFQGKELKKKILSSFQWVNDMFVRDKGDYSDSQVGDHDSFHDDKNDNDNNDEEKNDQESPLGIGSSLSQNNDYIEAYFRERLRKQKAGTKTYLHTKSLLKSVSDLITAGTESTTTNILWFTLFMINYPKEQDKAFAEIEREIGTKRPPNMEDKPRLNYVTAVVMETQRLASITPFPIMHKCSKEINISGFTLPSGTNVSVNLDSVFYDPDIWGADPRAFRPERHLDSKGEIIHREEFIPYSIGRRQCMAEAYAKTQLFMIVSGMLQKFRFESETPGQFPPMKDVFGLASPPVPYKVRCVPRSSLTKRT